MKNNANKSTSHRFSTIAFLLIVTQLSWAVEETPTLEELVAITEIADSLSGAYQMGDVYARITDPQWVALLIDM